MKTTEHAVREKTISDGVQLLKAHVRGKVPDRFGWWIEIDHDVRISIRWLWLGHPAVTHSGSVSDCDVTIALSFLDRVDWNAEVSAAMESVELADERVPKTGPGGMLVRSVG